MTEKERKKEKEVEGHQHFGISRFVLYYVYPSPVGFGLIIAHVSLLNNIRAVILFTWVARLRM